MRQLVGTKCVLCRERIPSVFEGRFCQACGCPVHESCIRPASSAPAASGACPACGAAGEDAGRERQLHEQEARRTANEAQHQRGFKLIVLGLLACVVGALMLVGDLIRNPRPGINDIGNAAVPLILGMALIVVGLVRGFRR